MRYKLFVLLTPLLFGLFLSSGYSAAQSNDKNITIELNLPAQTLNKALIELASQTGLEILFGKGARTNINTEALHGLFTLHSALKALLKDSGLNYTLSKNQIRIIKPQEKSHTLSKVTVTSYLRDDQDPILYGDDSQQQFPLFQLPLSIQSVSEKQLEEVQARSIDDVLAYVSGVEYFDRSGGINSQYYSRGIITPFSIDGKFYRRTLLAFDPGLLERIDLVQGPTANYMNPGGMLNFVTKKPKRGNHYDISFTGASEDLFRTEIDLNISTKNERKRSVRLVGVSETSNHVKDFAGHKHNALSSSFAYEFKNDAQFLLSLILQNEERYPTTFTYHDSVLGTALPRTFTLGLTWAESIRKDIFYSTEITNYTLSDWRISGGANYNNSEADSTMAVFGEPVDAFGNVPVAHFYNPDVTSKTYGLDIAAEKSVSPFNIEGLLRIGLDYQFFDQASPHHAPTALPALDENAFVPIYSFNINAPNYNYPKPPPSPKTGAFKQLTDFYGIHISQSYYPTDYLTVYADIRYEDMQFNTELNDLLTPTTRNLTGRYQEYTPKTGINVTLSESLSSHLSYAESFSYQGATNPGTSASTSNFVSPIKNIQYEYALKKRWFDDRIQNNLTFYKIYRSNIQAYIELPTISPVVVHTPNQKSKGVNFELSGEATENLNIIANISYNDSNMVDEITLLNNPENRAYASAKIVANTWLNYTISSGKLNDTSVAFGIKHVGERYGDNANTFTLPAYTVADAFICYRGIEKLTFKLAIRNLFNKYYYKSSLGTIFLVEEGAPRSIALTIQSAHNF